MRHRAPVAEMTVYCTVAPGVAEDVLAELAMVSPCTATVAAQRASVPPAGQFVPAVADVIVLVRILLPVSGLSTVTVKVMVAVAPAARFPVQVRFGLVYDTVPAVAAALPL